MTKWLLVAALFAWAGGDAFAQGMGGGGMQQGGGGGQGCDPGQMGANMGCPMPDCVDMDEMMEACGSDMDCAMEEWMDSMQAEMEQECETYSDCPFGEGMEDCDNSWVDQCGE